MKDIPHFVYLVSAECDDPRGLVKVGISKNVEHRIGMIQTASPFRLVIEHSLQFPNRDAASMVERGFHHQFSDECSFGEWFRMVPRKALFMLALGAEIILRMRLSNLEKSLLESVLTEVGIDAAYEKVRAS